MADLNNPHFRELFWFCVFTEFLGILFMAALVWLPVPKENQSMANIALGFDTATLLAVPLGYLLGGNPTSSVKRSGTSILPPDSDTNISATTKTNIGDTTTS